MLENAIRGYVVLIRSIAPNDYDCIIAVVDEWWGDRAMAAMLPKLFFTHFQDTSFIAEDNGQRIGFLVGFLSPSFADEAYIHFVGVHPDYRKHGVAKRLYEQFSDVSRRAGRRFVKCVTSPANSSSLAFHRAIGFLPDDADWPDDGLPIHRNYDGPGEDRVLLVKRL